MPCNSRTVKTVCMSHQLRVALIRDRRHRGSGYTRREHGETGETRVQSAHQRKSSQKALHCFSMLQLGGHFVPLPGWHASPLLVLHPIPPHPSRKIPFELRTSLRDPALLRPLRFRPGTLQDKKDNSKCMPASSSLNPASLKSLTWSRA